MSCTTPYTDPCGCQFQLDTKCVFYNSDNLTCLEVDSGSDLETILKAIDAKICTLNPDTPIVYNVRNLDGTITVVPTGTNPRIFTVSLSGVFLNRITNIESDINDIQDFIDNLSFATTTPGMTGSVTGNVITVNYTNPTTATKHGGIIYSDNTRTALAPSSPSGTGQAPSKYFSGVDYLDPATYDLQVGEQIKIKTTFQLPRNSYYPTSSPSNTFASVFINPSFSLEYSVPVNGDSSLYNIFLQAEVVITCTSLNTSIDNASITGTILGFIVSSDLYNGSMYTAYTSVSTSVLAKLNWSSLNIGTSTANQALSGDVYNNDFSIELIKLF